MPFAGVKRSTDDTLSKACGNAKKPKTVRKTSKSSDNVVKIQQTDDGQRDSVDNLSSGTMFAFIVFLPCYIFDRVVRTGDSNDEEFFGTENSVRRLNWQKRRQDWARQSKINQEIEKVTVDSITEVYGRMRKHGWVILRDCSGVFHPKSRFTREQMTYIDK